MALRRYHLSIGLRDGLDYDTHIRGTGKRAQKEKNEQRHRDRKQAILSIMGGPNLRVPPI